MKKLMAAVVALSMAVPAVASAQDRWERGGRGDHRGHAGADRGDHRGNWGGDRGDTWERREDRWERREDARGNDPRYDQGRWQPQRPRHSGYNYGGGYGHGGYNYGHGYGYGGYGYSPPRTVYVQPRVYNYAPSYGYGYSYPSYGYSSYGYGYPSYSYGYSAPVRWYRGQVLPPHYRQYGWYDYNRYGYAPPPHGYSYYRTDTGDIILAAIATGVILSVFAGAF